MSRSSLIIELLRQDYGLPDQAIASRSGVSRVHINYVLHGKRQASRELENALEMLLAECDRGERTRLSNTLARGKVSRREPPTRPRRSIQPSQDLPKPEPHFTPSPRSTNEQASGLSAWESKQASRVPPLPGNESKQVSSVPIKASEQASDVPAFVPSPVQAIAVCVACQRPGLQTRIYAGSRLCQWCATARGYKVATPKPTFTPLPTQHASFEVLSELPSTQHEPGEQVTPTPSTQAEDPPPDPSTWVFPRPGFNRDYQDYGRGMFCLACHAHTPTRQVRIANYTQARSVRLCEACCERYEV